MKPDAGECYGSQQRWAFDAETKSCRQFIYGGCGGNRNRFESEEECKKSCSVMLMAEKNPGRKMWLLPVVTYRTCCYLSYLSYLSLPVATCCYLLYLLYLLLPVVPVVTCCTCCYLLLMPVLTGIKLLQKYKVDSMEYLMLKVSNVHILAYRQTQCLTLCLSHYFSLFIHHWQDRLSLSCYIYFLQKLRPKATQLQIIAVLEL